jgi:hypothetical protein
MKSKLLFISVLFVTLLITTSCETEAEKKERLAKIEQERIELVKQQKEEERIRLIEKAKKDSIRALKEAEKARLKAIQEEKERKERELYNKYGNNSLRTGATPYSYCFGGTNNCNDYDCSQIQVIASNNSDVLVTIKKSGKVFRHAFIRAGNSYKFEVPNGSYQVFFYYGKGWYSEKFMKKSTCGILKGGFLTNEHFGKDNKVTVNNQILTYELILQQNGNFSTKPSSKNEAF